VATWCKGVVAKLTRATSNPLMRKYLGYVSQRLDAGEYTSPAQYWDEVYRSINAVEDPVNQGRLNPTMDEDKIAFRGFETGYSLAALDPEDRATYFESWFTEDVDHSRAGATEVKAALAECDVFFKDMSDDDVDKCIDIVRQNAGKFPVDSRHFLESFPAPGTMHHSRRKAADKSKEGSGISLSIGDGTLSDEEMVERRVRSAMSKRLTAEELRSDIERTMDKELRASYGPLYTTPSGALVRDVFREPIEREEGADTGTDKGKANDGSGSSSSSSKAKTTAELRAEAEETYKQRKAAYYEACPLSPDLVSYCPLSHLVHTVRELLYLSDAHAVKTRYLIHLCGCIPIQPKVLWNILKDEVMWCSPHSGMELVRRRFAQHTTILLVVILVAYRSSSDQALRKTKALKVVEDDEGEGKKSYIPRDLMKQIEHLIRDLGSNATVDKLMRQLDWGKNSQKKERLGPLREVLGRLPRVFYEPEYMFLRQSLEGVVAWPEDDERSEEAKTQEMTNNFNNWCRFSVNRAEVANNLVTMLSTPESCPQRRYPVDTARTYLATNGVNPDHELPLLTDLFIPGNNVYLRRGCEDEDQSSSSTSSSAAASAATAAADQISEDRVSEYIYSTLKKSPYRAIDIDALRKVIRDNFTLEESKQFESSITDTITEGLLPHSNPSTSSTSSSEGEEAHDESSQPANESAMAGVTVKGRGLYRYFFHDPLNIYLAADAQEYLAVKGDTHAWNRRKAEKIPCLRPLEEGEVLKGPEHQ
ncbi:Serine arginine-rich splicing factor 2, partial [Perkinsus olseni]